MHTPTLLDAAAGTGVDGTTLATIVAGLLVVVGLVGVVVPVLPGSVLVLAGVLVWAVATGTPTGWIVLAVATTWVAVGAIAKWVLPGRRLKAAGVPTSTMLLGGLLGVVGFFVIPVVGLVVGFVLGVYLAELQRVGRTAAWPATKHALKAAGLSILIELAAAMLATGTWVIGLVVT